MPPLVGDVLWSDPTHSDSEGAKGVHGSDRGGDVTMFGPDVTAGFCAREGLQLIVRSHQFVSKGVKFMHGGRLATLFSARNYSGCEANDSALLLLAADETGALRVRAKRLRCPNPLPLALTTGPGPGSAPSASAAPTLYPWP